MTRLSALLASAMLACASASAATIATTITVNATATPNSTFSAFNITGTTNMTGGIGAGTLTSSISLTSVSGTSAVADYNIAVTSGGTLTGKLNVPISVLTGGAQSSASVTITVTGGSGTYAGATSGTTPITLTGSVTGDLISGFKLNNFTGSGTITTGSGGSTGPTPLITAVQDAASNTPGIAQGSIFIVKGSTLSASGFTSFAPPRPTTSGGVKVTFTPTAGGAGTDAILVYLFNQNNVNQIACILPSTVAVGTYNVTVTNGTAVSGAFTASVVANKVGLFTQDSTGTGLASVQNYISASVVDLNRLTTGTVSGITISPAKPGQPVIAYGTGLGGYAAGDNTASPVFDFRAGHNIQAVVGGVNIPVDYAGRAGYAGEDQINFTLPANIPTGCAVTLQISVDGKLSPATSIAIAPTPSDTACVFPGYTTSQLQGLDQGGSIVTGSFAITQFGITVSGTAVKSNSIAGGFAQLTGFQLSSAAQGNVALIQSGSCQIIQSTSTGTASATGGATYLDAGNVSVTGPSGSSLSNTPLTKTNNSYGITTIEGLGVPIPGQTNFSLVPGSYSINGGGGPDVGSFNANVTLASPLTVTGGLPSSVNRNNPLTLNWTGGNATDLVEIVGSSSSTSGTGTSATITSTEFICLTTAGQKTFTVPASILSQLPATTGNNQGILDVASGNVNSTFTATLPKIGGNVSGIFATFAGSGAQVTWQ
jgi:fibronectin-binding autotransporter adhesin